MSEPLLITREERLLRLRLNRPAKRNALSRDLCAALVGAFDDASTDASVGAILLEAEGPVFCAGLDLDEILSPGAAADVALHDRLFNFGRTAGKPVVAAVQGAALAGGMALVANAHVAVAAQGTSFGMTEVRLGLFPYVPYRAVELAVGARRALELCLTGRVFAAPDALAWGLVHYIAPAFEFDDLAATIAGGLAASSADAVQGGLAFLRPRQEADADFRELAVLARQESLDSADLIEGVHSVREKRAPAWPSHRLGGGR